MKALTIAQILKICKENRYILLREATTNLQIGINCSVWPLAAAKAKKKGLMQLHNLTIFCSYTRADLMEYISHKIPFICTIEQSVSIEPEETAEQAKRRLNPYDSVFDDLEYDGFESGWHAAIEWHKKQQKSDKDLAYYKSLTDQQSKVIRELQAKLPDLNKEE